jgi:hypothetical protein
MVGAGRFIALLAETSKSILRKVERKFGQPGDEMRVI